MHAHYLDCFKMFNPVTREHLDVRPGQIAALPCSAQWLTAALCAYALTC